MSGPEAETMSKQWRELSNHVKAERNKRIGKTIKRILMAFAGCILAAVAALCILVIVLTVNEYDPPHEEEQEITGSFSQELELLESFSVMTWNVGFGALGETADFFMDGGKHVRSSSSEEIQDNLAYISELLLEQKPDVVFLQEVDEDSDRSHRIDEISFFREEMNGYQASLGLNYNCLYVPFPIPTLGRVYSGVMTFSDFEMTKATRVALPCPFSYPVRIANLKRCLLVTRTPIANSDKELVLVNLHLEAYDDGEGKREQTKELKELLQKEFEAGNYVVAGGDFNQVFSGVDADAYPAMDENLWQPGVIDEADFGEDLICYMDETYPTCRSLVKPYTGSSKSNFQFYMIDGFIVSSNIEVEKVETIDTNFLATDHNPVIMTLSLR